jgi:hypothetical protein
MLGGRWGSCTLHRQADLGIQQATKLMNQIVSMINAAEDAEAPVYIEDVDGSLDLQTWLEALRVAEWINKLWPGEMGRFYLGFAGGGSTRPRGVGAPGESVGCSPPWAGCGLACSVTRSAVCVCVFGQCPGANPGT